MMVWLRLSLRQLARDWRAGELRLVAMALIVAVSSLTSVDFFTGRVRQAVELQATELLAADLVVRSVGPAPPALVEQARALGLKTALTVSFRSVVVVGEKLQLAEVKAAQPGYPLRGQLRVSDQLFAPETTAASAPPPGAAWLDSRLFQQLGLEVGEQVRLGAASLRAEKVLTYEPDRGGDLFNIAPRLLMNLADLERAGLIQPGSRATHKLLAAGPGDAVAEFRALVESREDYDIQGIRDARPELRSTLDRAEQFLTLAVLVSIALAGLALALSAQRYAVRHFDNCAIMRCFGARQDLIVKLHFAQLLALALLCSGAGCALGYLGQQGLAWLMSGLVARALPAPTPAPVTTGMAAGVLMTLGFAMPQIARLKRVAPLRTLRRDLTPLPPGNLVIYPAAVGSLLLLTLWRSSNLELALYGLLGLLLTGLLSFLAARLAIRGLDGLRAKVGSAVRFGLANIVRRAPLSAAQILAVGLGAMALTLLTLVRADLLEHWRDRLPEGAPNYFLINIQPSEVNEVKDYLQARAGLAARTHPMVRARLTAINGEAVNPDDYEDEEARMFARRIFNLSVAETLQEDNRLVEGEWWGDTDDLLFSFEDEFAKTLNIARGDRLTFAIAEQRVSGVVANLRWVDWDTFNVNFFVVVNPGALDGYPATYITSFHLPESDKGLLLDLVRAYPSVTVVDVDAILRQVRSIMKQVIRAVEFVFGFTLLAGIVVLLAALQTTQDERRRESALLSTLGAGRRHIAAGLLAEFVVIGLIAGVIGALGATAAAAVLAEQVFRMEMAINPWALLVAPLLCALVVVAGGLAGARRVLSVPPLVAFREA